MHINTKGQVTIPIHIREKFGLLPNSEVEFVERNNLLFIVKKEDSTRRGLHLIKSLKNRGDVSLSTDEIMKMTRG